MFAFNLGRPAHKNETEAKIRELLEDESIQIISSFELNQIATLTYHESSLSDGNDLCELVFDTLLSILSKWQAQTPLTLLKALVMTKHVLIYGSEKVVNTAICLGRYVEALQSYNTVLLAQESFMMRIKGGGVDQGGPVREKAIEVNRLLSDHNFLRHERTTKADPNSLVPIGDNRAAFVTDDVRFHALKRRMEQQQMMETRSNLARADNSWGGGYNAKDGKSIVGAAHGLDEMIKMAEREKKKFSDGTALSHGYVAPQFAVPSMEASGMGDLLSMHGPPVATNASQGAEPDLLGFDEVGESSTAAPTQSAFDFIGMAAPAPAARAPAASTALWSAPSLAATAPSTTTDVWSTADLLGDLSVNAPAPAPGPLAAIMASPPSLAPKPVMGSNQDRFAALDALHMGGTGGNILGNNSTGNYGTAGNKMDAFASLTSFAPKQPEPSLSITVNPSSMKISAQPVWSNKSLLDEEDSENGFVMGGAEGTGLEPLGEAPAAPPPPPPSFF